VATLSLAPPPLYPHPHFNLNRSIASSFVYYLLRLLATLLTLQHHLSFYFLSTLSLPVFHSPYYNIMIWSCGQSCSEFEFDSLLIVIVILKVLSSFEWGDNFCFSCECMCVWLRMRLITFKHEGREKIIELNWLLIHPMFTPALTLPNQETTSQPEPVAQSVGGFDCGSEGMGFDPHSGQSKVRLFSQTSLFWWYRVVGSLLLHQLVRWCQYNVTSRP
jgi:hypothetical protein